MKQRAKILLALVCIALLFTACSDTSSAPAGEEARRSYAQAVEQIGQASDLTLTVGYTLNRTVGGETFSEEMTETISYRGLGTDNAVASVKQQVAFGPYETQYSEYFRKGTAYCQTKDSAFRSEMTIQQFQKRQIPAILVDAELYETVEMGKLLSGSVITFSAPKNLESWATDYTGAVLESASATVVLDKNGKLTESTYTANFTCASAKYALQVKVSVQQEASATLDEDLAGIPKKCPELNYFDAPRKILQVVGDVYTAQALSAEYTETVDSVAFARKRSRVSTFDVYGTGADFMAKSSYEVVNTDYSNTPTTNSEVVIFRDNTCTSSLNDAEPTVREGITADTMRQFCEDSVLEALFTPNYLKNATMTVKKGLLQIEFTGNTAFGDGLCNRIYNIFNANLDIYAEDYTTPTAGGYLCIDKATGLPTALGIVLERIHVSGDVSYSLTYQLDQTMELPGKDAYKNITG